MVTEQEKRHWRMGVYLMLAAISLAAFCGCVSGIITGWVVWHG